MSNEMICQNDIPFGMCGVIASDETDRIDRTIHGITRLRQKSCQRGSLEIFKIFCKARQDYFTILNVSRLLYRLIECAPKDF